MRLVSSSPYGGYGVERVKIVCQPFFLKVKRSTKLCLEAKLSAWNLLELLYYGKFGFSRPEMEVRQLNVSLSRKNER